VWEALAVPFRYGSEYFREEDILTVSGSSGVPKVQGGPACSRVGSRGTVDCFASASGDVPVVRRGPLSEFLG